ncbi:MAG: diguanylate cyclase [Phycisphaerae bacterium]|nr:diguanylate cyclase [Phycisphaerae bacterium]
MRVLIAEDDPISQRILQRTLMKWGYDVIVTNDGAEAWEQFQLADTPRLAILDWMMPKMDGPEVCQRVRAMEGGEYFFILLLTAKDRMEDIIAGLEAGANDYVIKPFNSGELRVRVQCGQRIVDLERELLTAQETLQKQATHDALTGLLNRGAVFDELKREASRAERLGKPIAVAMVDLDHFKTVNDTYGHAAGDAVLVEAAKRIHAESRAYDVVGRYGGEEFLIMLPETGSDDAAIQANRLREHLCGEPIVCGNNALIVTASIGIAATDRLGQVSMDELLNAADEALYRAKENGRNRVESAENVPHPAGT